MTPETKARLDEIERKLSAYEKSDARSYREHFDRVALQDCLLENAPWLIAEIRRLDDDNADILDDWKDYAKENDSLKAKLEAAEKERDIAKGDFEKLCESFGEMERERDEWKASANELRASVLRFK